MSGDTISLFLSSFFVSLKQTHFCVVLLSKIKMYEWSYAEKPDETLLNEHAKQTDLYGNWARKYVSS